MEHFTEVLQHLQAAYVAGASNTYIGASDGRISRIGALITDIGGTYALLSIRREAETMREEPASVEKKSPNPRKPSAVLMGENQAHPKLISNVDVADSWKGAAESIRESTRLIEQMTGRVGHYGPLEPSENERKTTHAWNPSGIHQAMETAQNKAEAKRGQPQLPTLKETISNALEGADERMAKMFSILQPADYQNLSGSAIAARFTVEQIEATLHHLGIKFDPKHRAKQKANALLQSLKA